MEIEIEFLVQSIGDRQRHSNWKWTIIAGRGPSRALHPNKCTNQIHHTMHAALYISPECYRFSHATANHPINDRDNYTNLFKRPIAHVLPERAHGLSLLSRVILTHTHTLSMCDAPGTCVRALFYHRPNNTLASRHAWTMEMRSRFWKHCRAL